VLVVTPGPVLVMTVTNVPFVATVPDGPAGAGAGSDPISFCEMT
jgi:hypothetical protein